MQETALYRHALTSFFFSLFTFLPSFSCWFMTTNQVSTTISPSHEAYRTTRTPLLNLDNIYARVMPRPSLNYGLDAADLMLANQNILFLEFQALTALTGPRKSLHRIIYSASPHAAFNILLLSNPIINMISSKEHRKPITCSSNKVLKQPDGQVSHTANRPSAS